MGAQRVLVVDDDPGVLEVVSEALRRHGYDVVAAASGPESLARLQEGSVDVIVLDILLPGMDGLEVCRRLRSVSDVPIIMLSAKSEEIDKVVGLEVGADDYLAKPFNLRELVARVRAVLRRAERAEAGSGAPAALSFPGLTLDAPSRRVLLDGQTLHLTRKEFDLLYRLASMPRRVFSRDELLQEVWGEQAEEASVRTVDTHVKRLRRKLGTQHEEQWRLQTVWGVGYRFDVFAETGSDATSGAERTRE